MDRIIQLVKGNRLKEVYLTGFIDEVDGQLEFCPDLRFLYFEFASGFLECLSIEQYSRLQLKIVDSVKHDFEIDEDMFAGISRAGDLILDVPDSQTNEIIKIVVYDLNVSEVQITCVALSLWLRSGQHIFLDPSFLQGIGSGSDSQKDYWEENLKEHRKVERPESVLFTLE
ncbi:hypothetical protein [Candidatus Enterococcus clewellii]|uniref:Uncharacterized protein n=1 Tax=Candidatus Enterococcus clewellii TaxID=1834193 RepID=A0A242KCW5_9ENTE|nr:hypothetical protein [Enterococcus sp. 9E7_DIV0242]OTP19011.1 hypothetical protein A5888_000825 [Enterococcus sp. 9E7_DIV0242]